jgi:glycosyltransferase involved in cell wall biosynthesis
MKVSVVTPTHDKAALLSRTLASLAEQDLASEAYEVIVVDDGSTDGTAAFLASYRAGHGFTWVRQEANRGRAAARNLGLSRAGGDLVVFLDDDMELVPGFLRAHREFHEHHANAVGVGNVVNHPSVSVAPIDRYMSTRGAQKIKDRGPLPWKYFSTNNVSVLRKDLDAVGGFDEGFVTYGFEDLELAYRLVKERGVTIRFVAEARSLHIHPHTLDEVLAKKTLCGRASLRYLFRKHPETRRALGYHRFDPPRAGDGFALNATRVLYRTLLTRPVYMLVKPLAAMPLDGLTNKAIDYLVQYHYLEGLRLPETPPAAGAEG